MASEIKTVLFDWGGVLSPGGTPDEALSLVGRTVDLPLDDLRKILHPLFFQLKRGQIDENIFWAQFELATGGSVPKSRRNIWLSAKHLTPSMTLMRYIESLQNRGYQVGILSNTFPVTAEIIRCNGWYAPFDFVILSSDIGLAKPDREIYEYALGVCENLAENVLFVDDQQRCLDPAAKLGMQTVRAIDEQQIIRDTNALLA